MEIKVNGNYVVAFKEKDKLFIMNCTEYPRRSSGNNDIFIYFKDGRVCLEGDDWFGSMTDLFIFMEEKGIIGLKYLGGYHKINKREDFSDILGLSFELEDAKEVINVFKRNKSRKEVKELLGET